MAQQTSDDDGRRRVEAHLVQDGDMIAMRINLHGTAENLPGVEYDRDIHGCLVVGNVVDAPRKSQYDLLREGTPILADFAVEADDGTVYRWNIDNGYVIGPNPHDEGPDRTDVGKFGGFYQA